LKKNQKYKIYKKKPISIRAFQLGKSSGAHPDQGELFNKAEQLIDEEATPEKNQDKESTSETGNKPKRKPLPIDLPSETVVVDIPDEEKSCDCCGNELHEMGEKKSERL
jgi:transposase